MDHHIQNKSLWDYLFEGIALALYGLSRIHLAPRPRYTTCIAEWITCGYCMDNNGFPRYPLYRLAKRFEATVQRRIEEAKQETEGA